ncbi:MAG: primosomal protein N' (replication factor Y) - superfamily II helicase, partial [Methylococcaceae bacterium]|nr:primosomal protein N' (replication factor Y) - superfamily II helicase [Methylococcaceae bacterium]
MSDIKEQSVHCEQCNAVLNFKAGTHSLVCKYCSFENSITQRLDAEIRAFNIEDYERETFNSETQVEAALIKCDTCSAETTLGKDLTSKECPFCGTALVLQQSEVKRLHKPHYLLPFALNERQAHEFFQQWVQGLWFAPNALKKTRLRNDKLKGVYLPFWSYDCDTDTRYKGQRGKEHRTTTRSSSGK